MHMHMLCIKILYIGYLDDISIEYLLFYFSRFKGMKNNPEMIILI